VGITYTWAVTGMKVTQVGSESNYVVQTYWTKTALRTQALAALSVAQLPSSQTQIKLISFRLIN